MNIYEELQRDFFVTQINNQGYIYYVPEKKMVRVKREIAEQLLKTDEKDEATSEQITYIINTIKKQMRDTIKTNEVVYEDKRQRIRKLELVVSTICNLNCIYCYADGGSYHCTEEIMSFSVIDALVEYLKQNKMEIDRVQFFGGEPMMGYETISYACRKFEENGIQVKTYSMISNFTFLPKAFIKDIKKYNINITVSLDGPSEITNRQRIGKNTKLDVYETVKNNITKLRNEGMDIVAIECTCTDLYSKLGYTKENLQEFLQHEFAIENIVMEDAIFSDKSHLPKKEEIYFETDKRNVDEAFLLSRLFGKEKRKDIFCGAGKSCFALFPDGNIYPCHQFVQQKEFYCLGNIFEGNWDKKENYKHVMDKIEMLKGQYKCATCNARNFCSQCIALLALNEERIQCGDKKTAFDRSMQNYLENRCIHYI